MSETLTPIVQPYQAPKDALKGNADFERLSLAARKGNHLRPMALEALLNTTIGMLRDSDRGAALSGPQQCLYAPALIEHPQVSTEPSVVAFTRWAYFEAARLRLRGPADRYEISDEPTSEVIHTANVLSFVGASRARRFVVDPFTPHAMEMRIDDAHEWCRDGIPLRSHMTLLNRPMKFGMSRSPITRCTRL